MLRKITSLVIFSLLLRVSSAENIPNRELPEGTAKVVAYLYDFKAGGLWIVSGGKLNQGVISSFTKTLSEKDTKILLDAFTEKHAPRPRPFCEPAPHHGLVFYSEHDEILGSVSVCFQCSTTYSGVFTHQRNSLQSFWDWEAIRRVFTNNGFPILDKNEDYTKLWKKTNQAKMVEPRKPSD